MMKYNEIPKVTKALLLINIAIFAIAFFTKNLTYLNNNYGAFYPTSEFFRPYQIITSMFLHANWMHLIFNMFGLWMFGGQVENYFGEKRYLILYFLSGIGAYALQVLSVYLQYNYLVNDPSVLDTNMVGASGAIFGILAAFAVVYPNVKLMLIFLPIPVKAKYFISGIIVYETVVGIIGANNPGEGGNVAHFAHVGGAVVGYFLAKMWTKNRFLMN